MRIGIDVGGTNTDAVLINNREVLYKAKNLTTPDITSGIINSIDEIVEFAPKRLNVESVVIGTTHLINSLLERKNLSTSSIIRLCLPSTTLLPPMVDWPMDMKEAILGDSYLLHGGNEFDGREISKINKDEIVRVTEDIKMKKISSLVINSVFSPIASEHERFVANIVAEIAPEIKITLAHEIGKIGLLERENAAILNASLVDKATEMIAAIKKAISIKGLDAPLFISQNDGTLMDSEYAARYPVFTISAGPTNSMRGAAFLSGLKDAIVVDIGGTSTDVGILVNGFPREASISVNIAGIRTNFRMPDVLSIALGGGSLVDEKLLTIGPESIGHNLTKESLVFGGNKLTTTDIAVAAGLKNIGNFKKVNNLNGIMVNKIQNLIKKKVENLIDRLKTTVDSVPVILVGGGEILIAGDLFGASEVIRLQHADVANAVGAAISQVGGQVEKIYSLENINRENAIIQTVEEAENKVILSGGNPETIELVEKEEIPLSYLPGNVIKIRAKVVADLQIA